MMLLWSTYVVSKKWNLLKYNNIEGMILLSELSRRRIRFINKLIHVGKTEPAIVVIHIDKEKDYIDLSKRRVSLKDLEKCTERFSKVKAVNSILWHVAELLNFESDAQFEELYFKTAWFYEERTKNKSSAYHFFTQAVQDPSILAECGFDENTQNVLLNNIKRKLTSQAVKIRADIEVACYGYEGIDVVKTALRAGLACSTEELLIKINLISPPLYVMTTATPEKIDGLTALQKAIEEIDKTILSLGGVFKIQMPPKMITASDEAVLIQQMEKAELEY